MKNGMVDLRNHLFATLEALQDKDRYHPFETKCRSCDKLIVWFNTPKGKKMPVDAETTKPNDAAHQLDLKRHKSHFSTCPNAPQHRRPR